MERGKENAVDGGLSAGSPWNGLLAVNKPAGQSSTAIGTAIKRAFRTHGYAKTAIGHVGTLDPLAEGVLCLLFGRSTKLQDYLLDSPKAYEFHVIFGRTTDTLDLGGEWTDSASTTHIREEHIDAVLPEFLGTQRQVPPLFSAKKLNGKALYAYARQGESEAVNLEAFARDVEIYSLEKLFFDPTEMKLGLRLHCSKGTYVRSLARDIAKELGTVAVVSYLCRTKACGVSLAETKSLDEVLASISERRPFVGHSLGVSLKDYPSFTLEAALTLPFSQGRVLPLPFPATRTSAPHMVYSDLGSILGIATQEPCGQRFRLKKLI